MARVVAYLEEAKKYAANSEQEVGREMHREEKENHPGPLTICIHASYDTGDAHPLCEELPGR